MQYHKKAHAQTVADRKNRTEHTDEYVVVYDEDFNIYVVVSVNSLEFALYTGDYRMA